MLRDFIQPIISRTRIRPERFHIPLAVIVKQRPIQSQRSRVRRIDQGGRITGAHLEKHAHREFAESCSTEEAANVVEGVARDDDVDAVTWAFGDKALEDCCGIWSGIVTATGKAEIVFLAQLLEIFEALDEEKNSGAFERLFFAASFLQFFGQFAHELRKAAGFGSLDRKRNA